MKFWIAFLITMILRLSPTITLGNLKGIHIGIYRIHPLEKPTGRTHRHQVLNRPLPYTQLS